ncbi:MAG: hypothetical protein ACYC2P_08845 [Paludibacteraceae bacterium]
MTITPDNNASRRSASPNIQFAGKGDRHHPAEDYLAGKIQNSCLN